MKQDQMEATSMKERARRAFEENEEIVKAKRAKVVQCAENPEQQDEQQETLHDILNDKDII